MHVILLVIKKLKGHLFLLSQALCQKAAGESVLCKGKSWDTPCLLHVRLADLHFEI